MLPLADGLWIKNYPLSVLGTQHGRTVTVLALSSGKLVVHSMAPFSPQDVVEIRSLGEVVWLVEAMLLHDTYAKLGRDTFPGVAFLGPSGFDQVAHFPITPLLPAPAEWTGEIEVVELKGAERLKEHLFCHIATRTLIVADLIFNFRADERGWDYFFHRYLAGMQRYPAMSRVFRFCIQNRAAFRQSIDQVMRWTSTESSWATETWWKRMEKNCSSGRSGTHDFCKKTDIDSRANDNGHRSIQSLLIRCYGFAIRFTLSALCDRPIGKPMRRGTAGRRSIPPTRSSMAKAGPAENFILLVLVQHLCVSARNENEEE